MAGNCSERWINGCCIGPLKTARTVKSQQCGMISFEKVWLGEQITQQCKPGSCVWFQHQIWSNKLWMFNIPLTILTSNECERFRYFSSSDFFSNPGDGDERILLTYLFHVIQASVLKREQKEPRKDFFLKVQPSMPGTTLPRWKKDNLEEKIID